MGDVIVFCHPAHLAISRAARPVSVSEFTKLDEARSVESTDSHHSAGMLSRCHHLETAEGRAPKSAAMASRVGQSSITARKDPKSPMPDFIGQSVLNGKAILSLDARKSLGHNVPMADDSEDQYKQEFMDRVRSSRIATGMKQWQIAEAMGIGQDKYKQYETRSLLPHHMIGRFCMICHVEPSWLVTGRGEKPIKPLALAEKQPDSPKKAKKTKPSRAA